MEISNDARVILEAEVREINAQFKALYRSEGNAVATAYYNGAIAAAYAKAESLSAVQAPERLRDPETGQRRPKAVDRIDAWFRGQYKGQPVQFKSMEVIAELALNAPEIYSWMKAQGDRCVKVSRGVFEWSGPADAEV